MDKRIRKTLKDIVAHTEPHKDAFVVPQFMALLERELQEPAHRGKAKNIASMFADEAAAVLSESPLYSGPLIRELFRSVLSCAENFGAARADLVEDLLFVSLRRFPEPERQKRGKQENARARVLQAALAEFSEKGFHISTIDSIAERAGIAKGTVYRHFKTKEDLFNALKEETIAEFVQLAREEVNANDDILAVLDRVITMYLEFFEKNSALFKIVTQEQKDFGREFSEKFINELITAFPGLKRTCWKASMQGRIKQMNYFTVFFGIVGFLNGVIQKWLHEGAQGSLIGEAATVKEILFYGLAVSEDRHDATPPLQVIS
jgi:AcrR family transcriptional regulator